MKRKLIQGVVAAVTEDLVSTLDMASALDVSTQHAAASRNTRPAVDDLLELEPLLHDARGLTAAAALLDCSAEGDGS
jgi:hypothetical protein